MPLNSSWPKLIEIIFNAVFCSPPVRWISGVFVFEFVFAFSLSLSLSLYLSTFASPPVWWDSDPKTVWPNAPSPWPPLVSRQNDLTNIMSFDQFLLLSNVKITCKSTAIMSSEQNLKMTCKLPINMAFDRKVWSGVRRRCNDADRGGQLEHHQDLPGVKGGKFFMSVAPISITSTPVSSPSPGFTWCQRWPYPSLPTIYL